jgi:hypothetical protein
VVTEAAVRSPSAVRGQAFGLKVVAATPLAGLVSAGEAPPARTVSVELATERELEAEPRPDSVRTVDLRFTDGRPMMSIDRAGDSYCVEAPEHGRHVVRADGTLIRSAGYAAGWRWQRLFYAQVLPLAAALQGVEVLHASAVAVDGRAVALIAASGTGKTTIAAHLVAAGADLLADDVLAVTAGAGGVTAYPGARFLNIDERELAEMSRAGSGRLGEVVARSDKVHIAAALSPRAAPLAAICFLRTGGQLRVTRHASPPTRSLLGASFLAHLRTPARLEAHLDVCAALARGVATYDVELPEGGRGADAAAALSERVEELA